MSAVNDLDRATVAALARFDHMTTARLSALQSGRSPSEAFALASGDVAASGVIAAMFSRTEGLSARWRKAAREHTPQRMGEACAALGVSIVLPSDEAFPPQLLHDPKRPAVLFVQGSLLSLDSRRVGIVGTRNPTRRGRQVAARFGHEFAEAGVTVISGLALGIDGAAHQGVLGHHDGCPVAVVANGHDQPYPRRHTELWRQVAARGAVISEWPPGVSPEPFRFPQRNRILAALSEAVVVVESRERGGSLITAHQAAERGIDVFAVPGPVDERACSGTNGLLEVGAAPAASSEVVLTSLGLDGRRAGVASFDARPLPGRSESSVLDLCRVSAQSVESVAGELGWSLADAALALARLERSGWLAEVAGWFEAVDVSFDLV